MASEKKSLTVGEIARRLDVSLHRVEYLIRARQIKAQSRAGNSRVFSERDFHRIEEALAKSTKGGGLL